MKNTIILIVISLIVSCNQVVIYDDNDYISKMEHKHDMHTHNIPLEDNSAYVDEFGNQIAILGNDFGWQAQADDSHLEICEHSSGEFARFYANYKLLKNKLGSKNINYTHMNINTPPRNKIDSDHLWLDTPNFYLGGSSPTGSPLDYGLYYDPQYDGYVLFVNTPRGKAKEDRPYDVYRYDNSKPFRIATNQDLNINIMIVEYKNKDRIIVRINPKSNSEKIKGFYLQRSKNGDFEKVSVSLEYIEWYVDVDKIFQWSQGKNDFKAMATVARQPSLMIINAAISKYKIVNHQANDEDFKNINLLESDPNFDRNEFEKWYKSIKFKTSNTAVSFEWQKTTLPPYHGYLKSVVMSDMEVGNFDENAYKKNGLIRVLETYKMTDYYKDNNPNDKNVIFCAYHPDIVNVDYDKKTDTAKIDIVGKPRTSKPKLPKLVLLDPTPWVGRGLIDQDGNPVGTRFDPVYNFKNAGTALFNYKIAVSGLDDIASIYPTSGQVLAGETSQLAMNVTCPVLSVGQIFHGNVQITIAGPEVNGKPGPVEGEPVQNIPVSVRCEVMCAAGNLQKQETLQGCAAPIPYALTTRYIIGGTFIYTLSSGNTTLKEWESTGSGFGVVIQEAIQLIAQREGVSQDMITGYPTGNSGNEWEATYGFVLHQNTVN